MSYIGLFDYLRQCGTVCLHEQNALSDDLYSQLQNARKMIQCAIKKTDLRVDIYDGKTAPEDKFVYGRKVSDCVYVEVKDLLSDKVMSKEFWKKKVSEEPMVRQIYRFIDKAMGREESRLDEMKKFTRLRRKFYLAKKSNPENCELPIYGYININI